jgi:hypothetical protein
MPLLIREASPHRPASDFLPSLWDPIHLFGVEFASTVLASLENKIIEALAAHQDICGHPAFEEDDLEPAALAFALTRHALEGCLLPTDRANLFAQAVAATLHHRCSRQNGLDPRSFYDALLAATRDADALFRSHRGSSKPVYIVRSFLDHYGLGGPDDLDLAFALVRYLEPELRETMRFLERVCEREGLLPWPVSLPGRAVGTEKAPFQGGAVGVR